MKKKLLTIAGIALLTICTYCFASTPTNTIRKTYDVQVIIFSHITPTTLQLEQWPIINTPTENAQNTASQTPANNLQREKNALQHNPNYHILVDASWMESWSDNQPTVTIPVMSNDGKLKGRLTISLGHYFNVNANLFLTEPTALLQKIDTNNYFAKLSQPNFTFQLLQNRRMRSNELNYLEHPIIGMLIKIIPVMNEKTIQ